MRVTGLTGEGKEYHDRVSHNVDLLVSGWRERVDYTVPVYYHRKDCTAYENCGCPVVNEKRTRTIRRPGLLEQLREFQANKDVNRDPKAERNPPRVKKPKMMPELNGFLTLDEITCDIYMTVDRVYEEAGRDRTLASGRIHDVLQGLSYQIGMFAESRPDCARIIAKATDKWVSQAKRVLNITVSDARLGDVVCGNCGGGLTIAWDNNSDVRCIGTPEEPPCGHTYPMSEWMKLYEESKRAQQ